MHTRRDRSSRPSVDRRRPVLGLSSSGEPDFAGAVDAVLSCIRRDPALLPDLSTRAAQVNLMTGLVDLAVSLAAHAVGTDPDAIDGLLTGLRDSDESIDLAKDGGV